MNGWFDDFDSLYDMYDNEEPTLKVNNYLYCIQQYGTKENPRKLHVSIWTDTIKVQCLNCRKYRRNGNEKVRSEF